MFNKIIISFITALTFFISNTAFTQEWFQMMEDPKANFYDIQKAFYDYWKDKTPEKGSGWMQFKRWEYFMEERVYPTGKLPDPAATYREITRYRETHPDFPGALADWQPLGPSTWLSTSYNPGIGRINCIAVHPTINTTLFAGAPSGGLWKSTNSGQNWTTATDNLQVLGVSSILIDPSNPNIMYIATGDGDGGATYSIGVLKSTNAGSTWNTTGLSWIVSQGIRIHKLLMHPSNSSIIIAATSFGIYRSTDAGTNWVNTQAGNIRDMEFKPGNPNILFAASTSFFKSTDNGQTFTLITNGLPSSSSVNRLAIGVSSANPSYVYILAGSSSNSGFYGFYRSIDEGLTFTMQSNSPNILGYSSDGSSSGGQSSYDLAVAVSPVNVNEVYSGGINIWKSTNGGVNWVLNTYWVWPPSISSYVHADIHSLDFVGTTLYSGCDGGLFNTSNWGVNWTDITAGMSTTQFYRIGGTPQNASLIYGGTQDNGSNRYDNGVWTHVLGADGMEAAIDYSNSNTVYVCIQNGGLRRSLNGGVGFSNIVGNITGSGAWVTPYVIHPQVPQTIFAGYQDIWKSTSQGGIWTKLTNYGGSTFRSLAVSVSNPDYIYAATLSTIYRTTDGGANWTDITSGLPGASITYIAVNSTNPLNIWVTHSGYTDGVKVSQSTNGGLTWTNLSGTLPNLPANCIAYDHPDRLFVGMDVGVYYRDASMNDWTSFMTNLPNVIVREMEIHTPANKIRAATYGRGLWETVLPPIVGITSGTNNIPEEFRLYQSYPNPFNPSTVIRYDIPRQAYVTLNIYDMLGRKVETLINETKQAGSYEIMFRAKNLASGVYYISLQAEGIKITDKIVLIR
jgi:photosystem II stability/assembly factor-like uncharacterized protein